MIRPKEINIVIGIGIIGAIGVTLFWILWFIDPELVGSCNPQSPKYPAYVTWENSFPLADAWIVVAATMGVIGLWKMRDWGMLFMLLAGGSTIFLGLIDLLYDLENGTFASMTSGAIFELAIVVLLLIGGPALISLVWRQRQAFFMNEVIKDRATR